MLIRPDQDGFFFLKRHFTAIADLNVVSFFCLFYSIICQPYNFQNVWLCNGICNFSNIFSIKKQFFVTIFNVKT